MSNRPTPRTDKAVFTAKLINDGYEFWECVKADFARELEIEVEILRSENEALTEAGLAPMIKVTGPLNAEIDRLKGKLDEAEKAIEIWREGNDRLFDERSDLRAQLSQAQKGEHICVKCGIRKDSKSQKGDF